ncbi:MAG: hypothetical protein A3I05_04560 [Deltaproteobacteria bacterium RIFCSPLOWO2_02_FULL_44_10]|nr:MAG: hypothetical protein A3C46_07365 [Deltaproteobacteria bacterium RIFCSPHIGHO2_02_FULL_44_16]OGQ46629.1 MAG: hypothetical protein A3I05_04560 [Deltaproteobacteria bacterium RIFCSPLOWO2_02_FULL_44_10]
MSNSTDDPMRFYHINRRSFWNKQFKFYKQGEIIVTSEELNPFYSRLHNEDFRVTGPSYSLSQIEYLTVLQSPSNLSTSDISAYAATCQKCVLHNFKLIRETCFESIRSTCYSDRPSRLRCLWFSGSPEDATVWEGKLSERNSYQLLEVEIVNGKLLRTDESWLNYQGQSLKILEELAHKYWQGVSMGHGTNEILYEGSVKIVSIIKELNSN